MKESKFELKNWKRWKHTLYLLEETKEQLNNHEISLNHQVQHQQINERMKQAIEESRQYDVIIYNYQFFINRLEKAINDLLNDEEKVCALIYANDPENANKREYKALELGISRTTYYKILSEACNKLDKVLVPFENQDINNYVSKTSIDL